LAGLVLVAALAAQVASRTGVGSFMAVAMAADCEPGCGRHFPADSGIINVRDFGAKGDGRTDDTAALRAAINAAGPDTGAFFWRTRIVYLPVGTYRVSGPLERRYAGGKYGSGMILVGESLSGTVIQLADRAPGFGDKRSPRGVVMTTAKLLDGTPTSGGKDYTRKGEGNDAYENFVENLTIDVGRGNAGAIGIDYLANNIGAIRDVRVIAPSDSGATGIAMTRKWPGPALLQRVTVVGFDTGISVGNTEYGVTLDRVRLEGQRETGLVNDHNAISAARLSIVANETAMSNLSPDGLIVLMDSDLRRAAGESELLFNRGTIVARGLVLDGSPRTGAWHAQAWQPWNTRAVSLDDAPVSPEDPPREWANVLRFAGTVAAGREPRDITDALRRAFASGAATVYLPHGRYTIHAAIDVPPTVRRIAGMNASLTVRPEREPDFERSSGMLRITEPGPPLTIERVAFDMTDLGEQLAVEVSGKRDVVLRDVVTAGTSLLDRKPSGGRVFIEDVCCGALKIAGPEPVIARQLDTEGGETRIDNDGGNITVLGLKTEGACTAIDNRNGATSTVLGGLLYIVHEADPAVPAFRDSSGGLNASFVEESLRPESRYSIYLQGGNGDVRPSAFPARGHGRIVDLLVSDPPAHR